MFGNTRPAKTKAEVMDGVTEAVTASKFIAKNTVRYETESGDTVIRLHHTNVVRHCANGETHLDTGGWATPTTRDRINTALSRPYSVRTHKGTLLLSNGKRTIEMNQTAIIGPRGGLSSDVTAGATPAYTAEKRKIDRWIHKLLEGGVPTDTRGDPFVWPDPETGKYSREFVETWLNETYVFGTFVANAIRHSGHTDYAVAQWISDFNLERGDRKFLTRMVRRYFRACLGFSV